MANLNITAHNRWDYTFEYGAAIPGYGGLTISSVAFDFESARVTQTDSREQSITLGGGSVEYRNGDNEISVLISLVGSSTDSAVIYVTATILHAFGTYSLNRYVNNSNYTITINIKKVGTLSYQFYLSDTWGPTVYYIRQNGTPRASQESVWDVTSAKLHDWGDYYYLVYEYSTYKDTYSLTPYLYLMTYSGHNLVGFTQGYYDSSLVPPWYITSSAINLLPNTSFTLPYNGQTGYGAVWRENTCPAIYEVYSNQWVPALGIAVNDGGTWKTPTAIYTYIEGRGWVQAPPSG